MPRRQGYPGRSEWAASDGNERRCTGCRRDPASGGRIGPGKVAVLEEFARAGTSSEAGRALKVSYRRTWELVEELSRTMGTPVVETAAGHEEMSDADIDRLFTRDNK